MSYLYQEHQHNFSAWAAARAAQRTFKGATVPILKKSLEYAQLDVYIQTPSKHHTNELEFDAQHTIWCNQIVKYLNENGVEAPTFGLAAKLVNVYLKSSIVLSKYCDSKLASIVHPPIDDLLLKAIVADKSLSLSIRNQCKGVRWTQFTEGSYQQLIQAFRSHELHRPNFWELERYWSVSAVDE
jgi:hypothetical protein